MKCTLLCAVVAFSVATTAQSQSYEDLVAIGDSTTALNNMAAPFVDPSTLTAVTNPSTQPRSPACARTRASR